MTCPPFGFRCAYGACVDGDLKCNGKKDCPDGSDENQCSETQTQNSNSCKRNDFMCQSGTCINNFLMCDGTQDCDDVSDESVETCGSFTCPPFRFRCDYGGCIDIVNLCNGVKDCADGSDEKEEKCGTKVISSTNNTTAITTVQAPSSGCRLPPQPENGQYKLAGCNPPACQPIPGNIVHDKFIMYECNFGFMLLGSEIVLCDSVWLSAFPLCSQASCPPLVEPSRDIECKLNDKKVECDKPMVPGTKAIVQCNRFYTNVQEFSYIEPVCQYNGLWTKKVTPCIPKCGEQNSDGVPFVSGGVKAKYGEYPWHAGIFRWAEEGFIQVCGGSIISEYVIVTAAHCFWDSTFERQMDSNRFKVAVGKFYRDWNNRETYIQTPEIDKIVLQERFRGVLRQWENDIALLILKDMIQMTIAVRPVCVDMKKEHERLFVPGIKGIVVGWGVTETMKQSAVLYKATLPYISFTDCEKAVPQNFVGSITNDKFCAGYQNGTSVCPGDSGGGYATQMGDKKWYLMGIVSVGVVSKAECNTHQYTTFTKVSDYYTFIQQNKPK